MMHRRSLLAVLVFGAVLLVWCAPVAGVIRVDVPLPRIFADSKAVVIGTVTGVNPDKRVVEVRVDETLKGEGPGERIRVQIVSPAELVKQVGPDKPLVVFVGDVDGKPMAVIHLADTWLLAELIPKTDPLAWRVTQAYDAGGSFKGKTGELVRLVKDIKAGKPVAPDLAQPEAFQGGTRELARLNVKPTFSLAVDLNGDKKLDLVVGTASGVRLFLAAADGYGDATEPWGLAGAGGNHGASGDINGDGRPDLLLGKALWLNDGGKFAQLGVGLDLPPESDWLAVALADATGSKRADVVVLLKSGTLITFANPNAVDKAWAKASRELWKGGEAPSAAAFSTDWDASGELCALVVREKGITRYACGHKAGPPAEFLRLTGQPLAACKWLGGRLARLVATVPVDCDGNGKLDYLLITETSGLTLLNRGEGTFTADSKVHAAFHPDAAKPLPFNVTPATALTPGQVQDANKPRQNLLILTDDGRLFEMGN